jgi:methionyl-tRNA formyltransferase
VRAIFFGTPQLAVPSLEALAEMGEIVRVICQPDKKAGRGMKLRPPPVKARALELGLSVDQPTKVKTPELAESLAALKADVALVVAYGRILPKAVLDAPRRGCVNVHASILPRWRGAAPIQWAVVHGDRKTGVCLMEMDESMDTGPVIAMRKTPIDPDETAGELGARLSLLGAEIVRASLSDYVEGAIGSTPQDHSCATYAPLLKKDDGRIDWLRPARMVHDRVRGMHPWPGAFTELDGARVLIHRTEVRIEERTLAEPGTIVRADGEVGIEVACGQGLIAIRELQLEGKKRMSAGELLAGRRWEPGMHLS